MSRKPMITRALVDKAIGPGGTPHARMLRALAVVLSVSKDEIQRREAAWRAAYTLKRRKGTE